MQELTGGIKNALERGENIEKIKQSFLNSGYSERDVNSAIAEIQANTTQTPTTNTPPQKLQNTMQKNQAPKNPLPIAPTNQSQSISMNNLRKLPNPKTSKPKKSFPIWLIILILFSILILIGAALLGFYWDKLFNILTLLF